MKNILRIAKVELNVLFYSPVAWLVLLIFIFQSGLQFTGLLEKLESGQEVGRVFRSLSFEMFANPTTGGVFLAVKQNLYLYIPLLTMGLMSRELHSGSIKLLLSSPVRLREIIVGKYLAMLVYGLLLMSCLLLIIVAGNYSIRALDIKYLFSGLTGLYLLLCAYSAIGLFMSCLTSYQVVAAMSTLVVFAILNYIGSVGQGLEFVRDLTYFLSINGRASQMILGLISSKDVLYFIIVIGLFLGFSILKLRSDRENKWFLVKTGRYMGLFTAALLLGYISSRPALTGYYDATANKGRTLTPRSQAIAKKIKGPVTVTTYVNLLDTYIYYASPDQRNEDLSHFEAYVRFLPDMKFKYVYYYDSSKNESLYRVNARKSNATLAEMVSRSMKMDMSIVLTPAQIRRQIDLSPEENRTVRILEADGRKSAVRMFKDLVMYPEEAEISAALNRLLVKPPKIAFLTDEQERSIDKAGDKDYRTATKELTMRFSLINQGFDIVPLSSKIRDIPSDITTLVIADPKAGFDTAELSTIRRYIAGGGNLLIAGEPGRQAILEPLLQPLGVRLQEGSLAQQSKEYAPDLIVPAFTNTALGFSTMLPLAHADSLKVWMSGTAGLAYDNQGGYNIRPLLVTTEKSEQGAVPTALSLTRRVNGKEQRIIVTGDADFLSSVELNRKFPRTANFAFEIGMFRWLSDSGFPVDVMHEPTQDVKFVIGQPGILLVKILFLGVLPAIILIFSLLLLYKRKRK